MMKPLMPSPLGHALAGIVVASGVARSRGASNRTNAVALGCVAAAVLPDIDLVHYAWHRTITHSVGTTIALLIITVGVTRWVTGRANWRFALLLAGAQASHMFLDWLGTDRSNPAGLMALWPFSDRWFISGWDIFPPVERRQMLSAASIALNLRAAAWEIAIMGPLAATAWTLTRRRRIRDPISDRDGQPPPSAAAVGKGGTSDRPARRGAR